MSYNIIVYTYPCIENIIVIDMYLSNGWSQSIHLGNTESITTTSCTWLNSLAEMNVIKLFQELIKNSMRQWFL